MKYLKIFLSWPSVTYIRFMIKTVTNNVEINIVFHDIFIGDILKIGHLERTMVRNNFIYCLHSLCDGKKQQLLARFIDGVQCPSLGQFWNTYRDLRISIFCSCLNKEVLHNFQI